MVDYGQNEKYLLKVENVDYYPELAGIKISSIPPILALSIIPLWFDQLWLSVLFLMSLFLLAYVSARREDEGRPLILNSTVVRLKHYFPKSIQEMFTPTIASIVPYQKKYRR